jgi:hypothetical protein
LTAPQERADAEAGTCTSAGCAAPDQLRRLRELRGDRFEATGGGASVDDAVVGGQRDRQGGRGQDRIAVDHRSDAHRPEAPTSGPVQTDDLFDAVTNVVYRILDQSDRGQQLASFRLTAYPGGQPITGGDQQVFDALSSAGCLGRAFPPGAVRGDRRRRRYT